MSVTATATNPTFTENGTATALFSGTAISTIEAGQSITGLDVRVTNLANGNLDELNLLKPLEAVRNNRSAAPGNAWQAPLQPWWQAACQISRWSYEASDSSQSLDRIWAIGTLLELLTLGYVFVPGDWNGEENREKARSLAEEMVRLIGDNRFPLESTIRQFERYASVWRCEQWDEVVAEILDTLKKQD